MCNRLDLNTLKISTNYGRKSPWTLPCKSQPPRVGPIAYANGDVGLGYNVCASKVCGCDLVRLSCSPSFVDHIYVFKIVLHYQIYDETDVYVWKKLFDVYSIWNWKCHVTFWKAEMNVNRHVRFLLKFHLNVTCLVVCVVSISSISIDMWVFFHKSKVSLHAQTL